MKKVLDWELSVEVEKRMRELSRLVLYISRVLYYTGVFVRSIFVYLRFVHFTECNFYLQKSHK